MTNRLNAKILVQLLVLAWPACSAAQPSTTDSRHRQAEQYRIDVEVNLVSVPVTVRGPRGTFVKELPQSAFIRSRLLDINHPSLSWRSGFTRGVLENGERLILFKTGGSA